jgi:TRAP-type C4-dicarboxylate transport system permease small subunit
MIVWVAVGMVTRKWFSFSLYGSVELPEYAFLACFLLSLGRTLREGGHIRIPVLYDKLPQRGKPWVDLVVDIATIAYLVLMMMVTSIQVMKSYEVGAVSYVLEWPMWAVQLLLPVGFAIFFLQFLVGMISERWRS